MALHNALLLAALLRIAVGARLALKLQKDFSLKAPNSITSGLEGLYNDVLSTETASADLKVKVDAQMQMYKELVSVFAEESEKIFFAPPKHVVGSELIDAMKKGDGSTYYEVPLYMESSKPVCVNAQEEAGRYKQLILLTARYSDFQALEQSFHLTDASLSSLSEESIDDLSYVRDHMKSFPQEAWSYSKEYRASHFYRLFRLIFRSAELRKLLVPSISEALLTTSFARSLDQVKSSLKSVFKSTAFVEPFVCMRDMDLSSMLPAGSPSPVTDNAALKKDIMIKFLDFNEESEKDQGKLMAVYNRLSAAMDGDDDVLVTCQTEAITSAHKLLMADPRWAAKWTLVGHGLHSGMTGVSSYNSQILNVFVKKPDSEVNIERWPLDWEKNKNWVHDRGWAHETRTGARAANAGGYGDTLMEAADFALPDGTFTLTAKTRLHETSGAGKGGASTVLSYQSAAGKPRTRIALVCAHLDSETQSGREGAASIILEEAANAAARSTGAEPWKQVTGAAGGVADVDAIFVTGDLNYRLWHSPGQPLADNGAMGAMIYTKAGRQSLGTYDMLRAPAHESEADRYSKLTRSLPGFGMQCNQPFESYLPTYKRRNKDACAELGTDGKMQECGTWAREACRGLCSSSDTQACNTCFTKEKTCESLAIHCATGSTSSEKESPEIQEIVDSGTDLGVKMMIFQDPVSDKKGKHELQLWITDVAKGSFADSKGITPGEWIITAIKETDVDYYNEKITKSPTKAEKWKKSAKVSDMKTASDIENKLVEPIQRLGTEIEGWKVRVTFVKPTAKWGLKEKQFLQLGWLDRLCWKTAPSSSAKVTLTSDMGMMNSKLSDHMPVHFGVSLKRP